MILKQQTNGYNFFFRIERIKEIDSRNSLI